MNVNVNLGNLLSGAADGLGKIISAADNLIKEAEEEKSTVKKVSVFQYEEFIKYTKSIMDISYEVCKSTVSLMKKSEMGDEVPATDYYVIRQVFLNEAEEPVRVPDTKEAFYGRIIYAQSVDKKFLEFMNGKKMKTFRINRGE